MNKVESNNSYDRLQEYGIKPSVQRMAVMEYLMEYRTHPSADEIYTALLPSIPTLSKTTVYNTLRLFAEQGAVQMLTIDEKNTNFDADTSRHSHFLCHQCGRIYDLPFSLSEEDANCVNGYGHDTREVQCYFKGVCSHCLSEK